MNMSSLNFTLHGLYPAPEIPFDTSLSIVEREFRNHVAHLGSITGVNGVAVNGYQGEIASLSHRERQRVIELARENLPTGKIVISGVHGLSLPDAVDDLRRAKEAGAQAALVIPPYDFAAYRLMAHSWESPVAYFSELANSVDLPLIIFQLFHRTGISYTTDTLLRLAEIDQVVGIKQAVEELDLYIEQTELLRGKIAVLAASDSPSLLAKMFYGADGALIGISNVGTEHWANFVTLCLQEDYTAARQVFVDRLLPIMRNVWMPDHSRRVYSAALMKEALVQLGVYSSGLVRPPCANVNEAERKRIRTGLVQAGLLMAEAAE
jgi:4-hydroxy-tetrahydrodipicolinate synthase